MFPYIKILKQAYRIVKTHKFLWIFGLFLVWGYLPNLSYLNKTQLQWINPLPAVLSGVLLVLLVILVLVYFRARAGLIIATKALVDKQHITFKKAWDQGQKVYVKMFQISLLVQISLSIVFLLLAVPVLYVAAAGLDARTVILGLAALIIFLPVWFIGTMVNISAEVFVGLYNMRVSAALAGALDLVLKCWRQLFVTAFSMFFLAFMGMILSVVPAGLVTLLFVIFGRLDYYNWSALVVSSIAFFFVQAVISVFHQVTWVLTILELTKPQKVEEEKNLAQMPEIA